MKILVDTHIVLALLWRTLRRDYQDIARAIAAPDNQSFASVVSLWEIAIKSRLGKLDPGMPLEERVDFLESYGLMVIPIESRHVVAKVEPLPDARDRFDRLLLAQCQVDSCRLATIDRALINHPLALKP